LGLDRSVSEASSVFQLFGINNSRSGTSPKKTTKGIKENRPSDSKAIPTVVGSKKIKKYFNLFIGF
jgi:hypothetical protein